MTVANVAQPQNLLRRRFLRESLRLDEILLFLGKLLVEAIDHLHTVDGFLAPAFWRLSSVVRKRVVRQGVPPHQPNN